MTEEAECRGGRQRKMGYASRGTGWSRGAHDSEGSAGPRFSRSPAASSAPQTTASQAHGYPAAVW